MDNFYNGRDINVGGDFNLTDSSHNEHKLLIHCSSEELLQERPFREENIKLEQSRKIQRQKPYYIASLVLLVLAALWAAYVGHSNLVSVAMGLISLLIGYRQITITIAPNAFQMEERDAVRQINTILKQRRVE